MDLADLLSLLRESPLVASVQASEGSPLEDSETLLRLAQASLVHGARVLRLQGVDAIRLIRSITHAPTIGLIKRSYAGSSVYITATHREVDELLATGCEVIALDGTARPRPNGESLTDLIARIHSGGRLAMADCDTLNSAQQAMAAGADLVGTTLSGYTENSPGHPGPDLDFVRSAAAAGLPVLAEGRYAEPWQAQAAVRAGAKGVVVGGALNDPVKQTRRFRDAVVLPAKPVGAVDIGGTWMRFGLFSPDWELLDSERVPLLPDPRERLEWIRTQIARFGTRTVAVGTGGTVDPHTGEVWEAKPIVPEHVGTRFGTIPGVTALNDGLATAWGHACLPQFAGLRVATLALGTGVGFGLVDRGAIMMGRRGEYPRLNDLSPRPGVSFEDLLGGAALTASPSDSQKAAAQEAAEIALDWIRKLFHPDAVVVCGGIGLADWLKVDAVRSPFGKDAGLFGAAALALFPTTLEA